MENSTVTPQTGAGDTDTVVNSNGTGTMDTSTEESAYECLYCDAEFPTTDLLVTHRDSHYNERDCRYCNITSFSNWYALKRHVHMNHIGAKTISAHLYPCDKCGQCYTPQNLKTHAMEHYQNNSTAGGHAANKRVKCTFCNKVFNTEEKMFAHEHVHRAERECPICHKVFASWRSVKKHARSHPEVRKLPQVKKSGTQNSMYKCAQCNTTFLSAVNLEDHVMAHQQCIQCGATFTTPTDRGDTGPKPVICPPCGTLFSQMFGVDM